jgi:acyl-CoA thioesterase I
MFLRTTALLFCMLFLPGASHAATSRIVALGDSLVAGYGLQPQDSYPAQLQAALRKAGHDVKVDNAGVSGDTTAGGVSRLEWSISGTPKPALVIVSLGANDMLRGLDPAPARANLRKILSELKRREIPAVLFGMRAATNLPAAYRKSFDAIYPDLAEEFDVPLYPFFLDGVALNPKLNLEDGVHPRREGVAIMVERTLPLIEKALEAE